MMPDLAKEVIARYRNLLTFQDIFSFYLLLKNEVLHNQFPILEGISNLEDLQHELDNFLCTTLSGQIDGCEDSLNEFCSWLSGIVKLCELIKDKFISLSSGANKENVGILDQKRRKISTDTSTITNYSSGVRL
jgi:hypothetical protein